MHTLRQQLVGNFPLVIDLCHRYNGIAPQMGIDDDRLRVGIADDTQSLVPMKRFQLILKARTEIVTFQRVDAAIKTSLRVKCYQTGTLSA